MLPDLALPCVCAPSSAADLSETNSAASSPRISASGPSPARQLLRRPVLAPSNDNTAPDQAAARPQQQQRPAQVPFIPIRAQRAPPQPRAELCAPQQADSPRELTDQEVRKCCGPGTAVGFCCMPILACFLAWAWELDVHTAC